MPRPDLPLIIPAETRNREFDAKLLLSCFAAERGVPAIVGSKKEINLRIASLPRSIFVSKSLTNRNTRLYGILQQLGHSIVCGDEEGLVYFTPENYLKTKVGEAAFQKAEALLAWGPENARNWEGYRGYHGVPIFVTGNARVDLLRPELRSFFDDEVARIRDRFGVFVLINTNFGRLNHYFPHMSWQRQALERAERAPGSVSEFDAGLAAHRQSLFERFLEMVGTLARQYPDHAIVVRPHPSESHQSWRDAAGGSTNVHVLHEGNVVPWLLAARVMIHNGCTTGIESHLLGRTPIAFRPVTSERFDLQLSNGLSEQAFDLASLLAKVGAALAGGLERDAAAEAARQKLLDRHVASVRGRFACERIVDALETFAEGLAPGRGPSRSERLAGQLRARLRRARKRLEARVPGHRNNETYVRHMFPDIALSEVRFRIQRYRAILGRFDGVDARQLYDNVFEVRSV